MENQFIKAVKDSNLKALKKLLQSGVDVNCRHPLGWNGLHTAVVNGHYHVIRFLIGKGADINIKDEFSSAQRIASQEGVSSMRGKLSLGIYITIVNSCY